MKSTTRSLFAIAVLFSATCAFATPGNNGGGNGGCGVGQQTNGCGGGTPTNPTNGTVNNGGGGGGGGAGFGLGVGLGGAGGAGGKGGEGGKGGAGGSVVGSGNSANNNTNLQGQAQGQAQGQQQQANSESNSRATGGNATTGDSMSKSNSGGNRIEGNKTVLNIAGDNVESNTPPVMPGVLPSVPTSCRLYLFGGGSTRDGAGSGTIPIGNDQTCLSGAKLNFMERVGGFTQEEKQAVVCKVEGMDALPTCRNLEQKNTKAAQDKGEPTDPLIRRRLGLASL